MVAGKQLDPGQLKAIQEGVKKIRKNSEKIKQAKNTAAGFAGAMIAARMMSGWMWGWHWWWGPWGGWIGPSCAPYVRIGSSGVSGTSEAGGTGAERQQVLAGDDVVTPVGSGDFPGLQ